MFSSSDQEAFQSYQRRSFAQARDMFREVGELLARAGLPQDRPSQLMGWRCQKFIGEPPGPR